MLSLLKKYNLLFVLPIVFGLAACDKAPELPVEPKIRFKESKTFSKTSPDGLRQDSVVIRIDIEDGDGDLGLSSNDTLDPYRDTLDASGTMNKYRHNYFVDLYIKRNGEYKLFEFPSPLFTFNGRFPILAPQDGRSGTLQVEPLSYAVIITEGFGPQPGDTIQFRNIHIADRALNESNRVDSDEIVVFQP